MNRYLQALWVLLASGGASAQSLPELLAAAEQRNLDDRQAVETRGRTEAESAQVWSGLLPALTATGGWTYNDVPAVFTIPAGPGATAQTITISPQHQLDAALRLELPLIDANRWFKVASASASVDSAKAREQVTRDQVRRSVLSAYYTAVGARAVLESALKSLQLAQAQLDNVGSRRAAGVGSELDEERARAEVERNRQLVAEADSNQAISLRSLESSSGLQVKVPMPRPDDDDLRPEAPLEHFEGRAPQVPTVAAADADAAAASRTAASSVGAFVPSVTANANQRFTNATGFQGQPNLFSAGLGLNWRLDVVQVQAVRAQRRAEAAAAIGAEKARQVARDQIHADWHRVQAALERAKSAEAQVKASTHAAQLAKERYLAGVANQVDVIQADRDVFTAEVARIQAFLEVSLDRHALRLSAALPLEVR